MILKLIEKKLSHIFQYDGDFLRLLFTSPQNSSFLVTGYSALYLLGILDSVQALTTHQLAKELIEKTTTKSGLKVFSSIFNRVYETGRKVAEGFKESMRIIFDDNLAPWNYVAVKWTPNSRQ